MLSRKKLNIFVFILIIISLIFSLFPQQILAESWVEQQNSGEKRWRSIASSEDGTKLAAGAWRGYIYTSSDSGVTWTEQMGSGSRGWESIDSSADGTKLIAGVVGDTNSYLYTSTDSGVTWTARTSAGSKNWYAVTSSADGNKLAAGSWSNYIYTSNDSGVTWTAQTNSGIRNWLSITSSSDGSKLAAAAIGGYIYTSSDSGVTWTEQTGSGIRSWQSIASSADGTKLAAGVGPAGYIYTSTDSGVTWTEQTNPGEGYWWSIASSADGNKLAAVVIAGAYLQESYIYISTDSGVTWTAQTSAGSRGWNAITSSADGNKLAAGVANIGYIYTYVAPIPPTTPTLTANNTTAITAISATLNGDITDTGGENATTRGFEYGLTDSYGITTIENGSFGVESFTKNISSLSCGETYYYRSYATNSAGTSYGYDNDPDDGDGIGQEFTIFTTSDCPVPPTLTANNTTAITAISATLNGDITDTGGENATTRGFEYGLTDSYGITTIENGSFGVESFTKNISSLSCGETYYYRSYATNSAGTSYGYDNDPDDGDGIGQEFTIFTTDICPLNIPIVTTGIATNQTDSSATLNGTVIFGGDIPEPTVRGFEYGFDIAYGLDTEGGGMAWLDSGNGIERPIQSLSCETEYHFRAYATNINGTGYGNDNTFTTTSCIYAPSLTTQEAIVTETETPDVFSAILNGTITSDGGASISQRGFRVQRGMTLSFIQDLGDPAFFGEGSFSINTNDLVGVSFLCGEENYYESYASNSIGTSYGDSQSFTTDPCPVVPSVVTYPPSSIAEDSVIVSGMIADIGSAEVIERGFEYGTTDGYGEIVTENGSFDVGSYINDISPLTCEPECHYRSYASNIFGYGYGEDQIFTIESSDSDPIDDDDDITGGYINPIDTIIPIPPFDLIIPPILDITIPPLDTIIPPFFEENDLGASVYESLIDTSEDPLNIEVIDEFSQVIKTKMSDNIILLIFSLIGLFWGTYISFSTTLFANPIVFKEIYFIPLRLWNLILAFFGLKRKRVPWGTVYDSVTKQPLDPAYVILEDLNGKEISTSITDLDGRYGFLVPSGRYRIIVNKTNYKFPSRKMKGLIKDELYNNLYGGEIIDVKEGEVITKNIPMDPIRFDWNEFEKKEKHLMNFFSKKQLWFARISDTIFYLGFIFTLVAVINSPIMYNIVILSLYILLYLLKRTILKPRAYGDIKEKISNNPLSFAIMRVFFPGSDNEITHKVADKTGKYYCLVPNGTYYAKIESKNFNGSYALVHTSPPIEVTKGYINNKFEI